MFAPDVKRDPIYAYISHYCQDVLAVLAEKAVRELKPSYEKEGLTEYILPHAPGETSVSIVIDSESEKQKPFEQYDFAAAPAAVKSYLHARMYRSKDKFFLASPSGDLAEIMGAVAAWNPVIADSLSVHARGALSADGFLNECVNKILEQTASLDAWVDKENQVLSYNGEEAVTTGDNLRSFISSYLKVFKMDGHLILEHNGSAKTMVRKVVPGGAEWYSADMGYGYAMERKAGTLVSADWDEDLEKNLMPYLTLKHIFKDENCIVKVVNGVSIPVSKDVVHLEFCITAICEDLSAKNEITVDSGPSL